MSEGAMEKSESVEAASVSEYFSMALRDRTQHSTLRNRRFALAVYC